MLGKLLVIGTPIGNLEDLSFRAARTLFEVEMLLCEDTRQTGKLLQLVIKREKRSGGVKPQLIRFDETKERVMTRKVMAELKAGKRIGLVTDAGMPGISDPGLYLVDNCLKAKIPVEVIPGPSAVTTALVASGFEGRIGVFLGFLPKKKAERVKIFNQVKAGVVIIYESPFRLRQLLQEIQDYWNNPVLAVCGELTKKYEKVIRGKADEVLNQLPGTIKGEWVVVVKLESK